MKLCVKNYKLKLSIIAVLLAGSAVVSFDYFKFLNAEGIVKYYNRDASKILANTNADYVYVSDLPFMEASTKWGKIHKNTTDSGNNFELKIDNSYFTFDKGIWAHATSNIVIDLREYSDYAYFTTYYGVNKSSNNNGNGVKFYIYVSKDGSNWELKTDENPVALKSSNAALYAKVDIRGYNYLRLYAHDNGANGNDHSVWADAKLIKESYKENDATKSLAEYDEIIKTKYANTNTISGEYEKVLLQREFVRRVGQFTLNAFANANLEYKETLNWLMNDVDSLRLYLLGGEPDGSYYKSLQILSDFYHKYRQDWEIKDLTNFNNVYGDLYKRMAFTLALTHSETVGLWMNPNVLENQSDPLERYEIFKDLHKSGKFKVSERQDHTGWYEALHIEEMRFVLNNIIDDEEIYWLYDYTQKYIDANPGKEEEYLQPHHYMKYIWPDYSKPEYYDEAKKEMWSQKYGNFLDYGVTYKVGVQKLWMNLDNGAVCGGISKIGSNIRGVHGTPSSVISQPGHAALIYYRKNADGLGYWTIDNDVYGWSKSGRTERLSLRMPLGWGDEEYIDHDKDWLGLATYVLLAQGALNDFDNYQAAEEILMQADVYSNDINKLRTIYREALAKEPIHIDAWYGLIKTYRMDSTKTDVDYYNLAEEIFEALKYYPLPMYHLAREIEKEFTTNEYKFIFNLAQTRALTEASQVTEAESIQVAAVKQEANYLLEIANTELASFSFNGDDAGKLVLNNYEGSGVRINYSLDGKKTWKNISFSADSDHKYLLSDEEIASINVDDDIYVHVEGVSYDEENLYKIDIQKNPAPTDLYANDLENRVIGAAEHFEWRIKGDKEWTSYEKASPILLGDVTVEVRVGANGVYLPSDILTFEFKEDNQENTRKYIPISYLSIEDVSTEATNHQGDAKYSIDGNYNTRWHSDWNGKDTDKFIIIKLAEPVYLTAMDYVPCGGGNGKILEGQILGSLDGENFTEITTVSWENNEDVKTADFEATEVQYVKIVGTKTSSASSALSFMAARMFNFYQDLTKNPHPTAGIGYSITEKTNQNVIARLINPSSEIKITNNNGSNEYTFTKNGSFTFEFVDERTGLTGKTTAVVDWIDKVVPTATFDYSTTKPTNKEVVATLKPSENIEIINQGYSDEDEVQDPDANPYTVTFSENGEYTFEFVDEAGNKGSATAKVDWIDKIAPTATFKYSNLETTTDPVTVTLVPNEKVRILNNNGSNEYTFTENGTFTFEFVDEAGNLGTATTLIDWISKKEVVEPGNPSEPSEDDNQKTPTNPSEPAGEEVLPSEPTQPDESHDNNVVPTIPSSPNTDKNSNSESQTNNQTNVNDNSSENPSENDKEDSTNKTEEIQENLTQEATKRSNKLLAIVSGLVVITALALGIVIKTKNNK